MRVASRGMGRDYCRGGIWYIEIPDKHAPSGKYRESSHSTHEADATALRMKRLGERAIGTFVGHGPEHTKYEDIEKLLIAHKVNNKHKGHNYLAAFVHLKDFYAGIAIGNITATSADRYIEKRKAEGAADGSISLELGYLKQMLGLAERRRLIIARPVLPSLRLDNARLGFFTADEFEAVWMQLPAYLKPLMRFHYLTGWRRSEGMLLTWDKVNFPQGTLLLPHRCTKNKRARLFPFTELAPLAELLTELRAATDVLENSEGRIIPWVFHNNGHQIKCYKDAWLGATKRAGCTGRLVHDFRRTAARNMIRMGVHPDLAVALVGWSGTAMLRRYGILDGDRELLATGVTKYAEFFQGPKPSAAPRVVPFDAHQRRKDGA